MEMAKKQQTLFDERFLGRYAGAIMSDPTTALVELVANAWDAYATEVEIVWPEKQSGARFSIVDNGSGMTRQEFESRWVTLDYNRLVSQGEMVDPPSDLKDALPRQVYGRNGRGRHAAFCFSSPYGVRTCREGVETTFEVSNGMLNPIEIVLKDERPSDEGHGTEIYSYESQTIGLSSSEVRSILSTRFLLDPTFKVFVDNVQVKFDDIPSNALHKYEVSVPDLGVVRLTVIDSQRADRTTKQHGVAWWVGRRLVGAPTWDALETKFIDGRKEEAKRYSFIVEADFLHNSVKSDWSGFKNTDEDWNATQKVVYEKITEVISQFLTEKRAKTKNEISIQHGQIVASLPNLSRERWNTMLDELIEKCSSMSEAHINQVMGILANMELAQSQYSLLEKLHTLTPDDLDSWNSLLEDWTIRTAKEALDEIAKRLKLIEEIREKTSSADTDEVGELQPLFERALWIFGPQFESIEYTSNKGMSTVVRKLFQSTEKGSLNRPDFVVLPDSSIGFYSLPAFDGEFNECGTHSLVVIELKRPGVKIGSEEKGQAWRYIKELKQRGHITAATGVMAYVLGDSIEEGEAETRKEGTAEIRPMLYSTFISQAEKRMLNLHKKLIEAPFMKEVLRKEDVLLADEREQGLLSL